MMDLLKLVDSFTILKMRLLVRYGFFKECVYHLLKFISLITISNFSSILNTTGGKIIKICSNFHKPR